VDDLDARAVTLAEDYAEQGSAAFVIRTVGGNVRVIGIQLDGKSVARMLRRAADMFDPAASDAIN
jgi:hypothetical protein